MMNLSGFICDTFLAVLLSHREPSCHKTFIDFWLFVSELKVVLLEQLVTHKSDIIYINFFIIF